MTYVGTSKKPIFSNKYNYYCSCRILYVFVAMRTNFKLMKPFLLLKDSPFNSKNLNTPLTYVYFTIINKITFRYNVVLR